VSTSPYLAILSTRTAIAERIARAEKVWTLHLSTGDDLDLSGLNSPVPFLHSDERLQLRLDGWLLLLLDTEDAARLLFDQVVGDDGPTQTNSYTGPHRVYAYLAGPNGGITENT
jgi:hypothetical protein